MLIAGTASMSASRARELSLGASMCMLASCVRCFKLAWPPFRQFSPSLSASVSPRRRLRASAECLACKEAQPKGRLSKPLAFRLTRVRAALLAIAVGALQSTGSGRERTRCLPPPRL
eukprot:2635540-Pleurochrysis_carterae.AAC.2